MAADLYFQVTSRAGSQEVDLSEHVSSLTVEEASGKPDALTLDVADPDKVLGHAVQEGMTVEVDLGTVEEHSLVFRGRIYKVEGAFPRDDVPSLRATAYDASMAMGLKKRNRPWTDMKLSDIANAVAGDYFDPASVSVEIEKEGDLAFTGNGIRQQERTDLDFLNYLAKRYGCEVYVVPEVMGDKLVFTSQYHIMTSDAEVTLYHGRSGAANRLLSFEASTNVGAIQLPRVVSGMGYEGGEATEATTSTIVEVGQMEDGFADENLSASRQRNPDRADRLEKLIDAAPSVREALQDELGTVDRQGTATFLTEEETQAIAANQFSASIHGMHGSGSTDGNPRIHARAVIDIEDVGGRFSGIWYVSEVRHTLDAQGYQTEFECQR